MEIHQGVRENKCVRYKAALKIKHSRHHFDVFLFCLLNWRTGKSTLELSMNC